MTTLTLPPPVFEPARPKSRSRTVNYFIEGTETPSTEFADGTSRKAVQITVGHSKDRKQFYASAGQVTITHDPRYFGTVTSFWLFNGVTLATLPVARFSAKALDEFTAKVVKFFDAQVAVTPKLQEMFTTIDKEPT